MNCHADNAARRTGGGAPPPWYHTGGAAPVRLRPRQAGVRAATSSAPTATGFAMPRFTTSRPVLTPEAEERFVSASRSTFAPSSCRFSSWCFTVASRCCFLNGGLPRCKEAERIERRTGCVIKRGVTTNGILVDDGMDRAVQGLRHRRQHQPLTVRPRSTRNTAPISKAAATPAGDPGGLRAFVHRRPRSGTSWFATRTPTRRRAVAFVAGELGMKQFDMPPPDATDADNPAPIADYFIRPFDVRPRKICAPRRAHRDARRHDPRAGREARRSPIRSGLARSTP